MKAKWWITGYLVLVLGILGLVALRVIEVDPYFHYHVPNIEKYYYTLGSQRSINDGISKNFTYDALITGTSMTENFKTSEMDELFDVNSVKVSYSGASFKEVNDNLIIALEHNPDLKIIVRSMDMDMFNIDSEAMEYEEELYPRYLYDDNIFNDVKYLFNKDVVFRYTYPMIKATKQEGFEPGMSTFDEYSNWMPGAKFGANTVYKDGFDTQPIGEPIHMSEEDEARVRGNIQKNVVSLTEQYPDVTFYYFITPYSIKWWQYMVESGRIYQQTEIERLVIEELLKCENIKLYSFNNRTDIVTDLNHFKDSHHYGEWINSAILYWMSEDKYLLTEDNYNEYLEEELTFYSSFDYEQLINQIDNEDDENVAELVYREIGHDEW